MFRVFKKTNSSSFLFLVFFFFFLKLILIRLKHLVVNWQPLKFTTDDRERKKSNEKLVHLKATKKINFEDNYFHQSGNAFLFILTWCLNVSTSGLF